MHHFYHSWRHRTFDPDLKNFVDFDPLRSTHHHRFRFYRGRMMYCHGPSRILWFTIGAFAATWYHREYTRGEFRGWGRCGNRRIEEWRAERIAETAPREQHPANDVGQQKNETIAERSWRSASLPSFEDEEVRRKWDDKTRQAQETVAGLSESALDGIVVAAESLKARLTEFRQSQGQEQQKRRPPSEEPEPRHVV